MDTAIDSAALTMEPTAIEVAAAAAAEVEETSMVAVEAATEAEAIAEATDEEAVAKETDASPPLTLIKRASSKRLSAKARAAMETAKKEEEQAMMIASIDHSYLSFLNKRLRSSKKKLEKIKSLETARSEEGKILNVQQLELVGTKAVLEKLIAEMDSLREQFIEVYLQEEASKKELAEKLAAAEAAAAEAAAIAAAALSSVPATVETKEVEKPVAPIETTKEEASSEAPVAVESKSEEKPLDAFEHVEDLLKTLHVVNLYNTLGKEIPMVLDFFAKVLLGNTRPPAELSYEENLAESLEEARKYLLRSDKIVACDMSYRNLRDLVEHLTKKQEQQIHDAAAAVAAEQAEMVVPLVQELPHINFFTDSQLESTDSNASVNGDDDEDDDVDVTDDKETLHADGPEEIETPVEEPETADNQSNEAPKSVNEDGRSKTKRASSGRKSAWNRSKSRTTSPDANSDDNNLSQQQPRRRTSGTRWKQQSNSNNSNNSSNNGTEGTAKSAPGSKPRRPRVQRNPNDENTNVYRSKDERQPRSERTQYQPRQRNEKSAPRA